MDADASDLLLFARVMDAGSFSRAADRTQLPKSTVSRRIAALEKRLGEKLLQRTTRKLTLTDFGESVLIHARVVAAEVDGALALALHRQATPIGRLRVSMPEDFANLALTGMLTQFVIDHPLVSLEIDLSPRRVDLIGENFDLAIRMGALPDDSQLSARRLASFDEGLYASPTYLREQGEPVTPDALRSMHALMVLSRSGDPLPWKMRRRTGDETLQWEGAPDQRTLANSPDLLLKLARGGAGIAAAATFFTAPYVQAGDLVRVLPDWQLQPSTAWAVFPGRRLMPTRTRAFLDALIESLKPCEAMAVNELR
ncbi:MAG: LysR family transcriptional regulator [Burkholderiales bacterium]|nr:LysR family transcriptional regulator [Burkholderiales bacterium]